MEQKLLRKVQLAQLEIAKEIERVCRENNIKYFLDSGSLLGAVRHQGFIPWDDDMDFGMLYAEYTKFVKIAPEKLGNQFFLQTWESDDDYPFPYSKVLKKGTEFVEDVFEKSKKRTELFVDVFPYFPFPDSVQIQRKQKFGILLYGHILKVQAKMTPWVRPASYLGKVKVWIKYLPFMLLAKMVRRETAIAKYKKTLCLSLHQKSHSYFPAGTTHYKSWIIPDQCFKSYTELPFEDTVFKVPIDYKMYLQQGYGNYMELPPEDERKNGHWVISVKL